MKTILAAATCAFFTLAGAATAATTYDIDQAFWGTYPTASNMGFDVWQAQRQNAVNNHPDNFRYLRGWVSVDWDNYTIAGYALDMDITINGVDTVAHFAPNAYSNAYAQHDNTNGNNVDLALFDMTARYGPQVERAGDTSELYQATLFFGLYHFLDTDDLTLLTTGALGGEFTAAPDPASCNPYFCGPDIGQYIMNDRINTTRTYGGGYGVTEAAPVPLPASAWLLLGGLGLLATAHRRKQAGAS